MKLLNGIFKCFVVYVMIVIINSNQIVIEKHIEIASKNMTNISQTFKDADKAVREYSKEYNEYLDSTFR